MEQYYPDMFSNQIKRARRIISKNELSESLAIHIIETYFNDVIPEQIYRVCYNIAQGNDDLKKITTEFKDEKTLKLAELLETYL